MNGDTSISHHMLDERDEDIISDKSFSSHDIKYNEKTSEFKTNKSSSHSYSGYLYKKPEDGGKWRRRFFETNGTYLTYYKNDKMKKLLAAVNLQDVGDIKLVGEMREIEGTVFKVEIKDRTYMLGAESVVEAERWVAVLRALRDTPRDENAGNQVENQHQKSHAIISNDEVHVEPEETEKHEARLLDSTQSARRRSCCRANCCKIS